MRDVLCVFAPGAGLTCGSLDPRPQAHVTAQTLLYAIANASPTLHAALLRTVVPTLEALWLRAQVCRPRPPPQFHSSTGKD